MARRAGRQIIPEDLRAAFGADEDPAMTQRIAIHECGHALVTAALGHGQIQHIALDRTGGQTRIRRAPRAGLIADHSDLLAELMAGRAAERLIFGEVTSGAGGPDDSDLALATRVALAIETRFGLGAEGPLWLGETTDWLHDKAMRHRLRARIEAAEAQALQILTPYRALLKDMAQALATRRELSGQRRRQMARSGQEGGEGIRQHPSPKARHHHPTLLSLRPAEQAGEAPNATTSPDRSKHQNTSLLPRHPTPQPRGTPCPTPGPKPRAKHLITALADWQRAWTTHADHDRRAASAGFATPTGQPTSPPCPPRHPHH